MGIELGTGLAIAGGAQLLGGVISGIGAQSAGEAQAKAAQDNLDFQKQSYKDAELRMNQMLGDAQQYSKPSPSDIKSMEQLVTTSERTYKLSLDSFNQAQKVLDAVNPAIVSAGTEAYKLINGEASKILGPLKNTRDLQRQKLQSSLAEKMGPGFRYTAAGIKALNDFDNQTADVLNNAQMGAINTVVNAGNGLSNIASSAQNRALAGGQASDAASNGVITANSELSRRALQPYYLAAQFQPNPSGVGNAGNTMTGVVGNQFAGQIGLGQSIGGIGANIGQVALMQGLNPSPTGTPVPDPTVMLPAPGGSGSLPSYMNYGLPANLPNYNVGDFVK